MHAAEKVGVFLLCGGEELRKEESEVEVEGEGEVVKYTVVVLLYSRGGSAKTHSDEIVTA